MLHGDNLTPHRAIWTLATISAVLGAFAALFFFCGSAAPDDKTIATLPHSIWYALGIRFKRDPVCAAKRAFAGDTDFQLWNVRALRHDQRHLHSGLPRASLI